MLHQVSGAGGLGVMDMVLGSGPVVTAVLWLLGWCLRGSLRYPLPRLRRPLRRSLWRSLRRPGLVLPRGLAEAGLPRSPAVSGAGVPAANRVQIGELALVLRHRVIPRPLGHVVVGTRPAATRPTGE